MTDEIDELAPKQKEQVGLSLRVVVFAILAMLILSVIVQRANVAKLHSGVDVTSVPSPAAILIVVLAMCIGALLNRFGVRLKLSSGELSLLYIIISVGGLLLAYGLIGPFVFIIMTLQRLAVEDPTIWFPVLEKMSVLVLPKNDDAVIGFWLGETSVPWSDWIVPLVMWGIFFTAVVFVFVSMASLVRQRWIEHERLRFPVVLPLLEMIEQPEEEGYFGGFWTDRLMWIGALIAVIILGSRTLNAYFPAFPAIPDRIQLGRFFQDEPFKSGLNQIPALDFYIVPLTYGIGYFVSLDITFTFWLTYLLGQMGSRVVATAYGNTAFGMHFQYLHGSGVWIALAIALFWMMRSTIKDIVVCAINPDNRATKDVDDLPMSYNTALFGGLIAFVFVVLFSTTFLQFTPIIAAVFWAVFFLQAFTFARLRAESGLPTNDAVVPDFRANMAWAFGTHSIKHSTANMTWGYVLNMFQAVPAMTLEGFKLAHQTNVRKRSMVIAIFIAFVCAYVFGVAVLLPMIYEKGAGVMDSFHQVYPANNYGFGAWVMHADYQGTLQNKVFLISGLLVGFALMFMRTKFLWWPLHPVGYAGVWQTGVGWGIWGPFFAVWLTKFVILRYGGNKLYQKLKPVFLGMIIGSVGMSLVGTVLGVLVGK